MLRDLQNDDHRLIARVAPRGHGKSVLAAFAYPLWCLCERKRLNIVIITHEASLATQFVRDIRTELESNDRILETYGDLSDPDADLVVPVSVVQSSALQVAAGVPAGRPPLVRDSVSNPSPADSVRSDSNSDDRRRSRPKWTEDKFTAANGVTLQARGVGASFRGTRIGAQRPDLIICDDIEKDDHVETRDQRVKLDHWLRHVVMPALAPNGRLLVLGSLLHYDSLLASLADRNRWPRWTYKVYRALEPTRIDVAQLPPPTVVQSSALPAQVLQSSALPTPVLQSSALPPPPSPVVQGSALPPPSRPGVQSSALAAPPTQDAKPELCTTPSSAHAMKPLWPARWPVERLEEERQRIGTRAFEQEYQGNPVDDSLRVFRPEWLRRCTEAELAALDAQNRLTNIIAVDPATGTESGDYFALWVGGVDKTDGTIYTRELRCERIGVIEQMRRIIAAYQRWKPVRVGIETNAYQTALKQVLLEQTRQTGVYMPVTDITAVGEKKARIAGSSAVYESGAFRLPAVLDPEVEAQFLHFPKSAHDDAPDACAMGIEMARVMRPARPNESELAFMRKQIARAEARRREREW